MYYFDILAELDDTFLPFHISISQGGAKPELLHSAPRIPHLCFLESALLLRPAGKTICTLHSALLGAHNLHFCTSAILHFCQELRGRESALLHNLHFCTSGSWAWPTQAHTGPHSGCCGYGGGSGGGRGTGSW